MNQAKIDESARQMGKAAREYIDRLWRECGGTGPAPRGEVRIYLGGPYGAFRVWPPEKESKDTESK